MLADGKLAVPGAEAVVPAMARLVGWARANAVVHVASADDHELTDPEISATPDFRNTYPPHCLRGTRGAQRVSATEQVDPLPLSHVAYPPGIVRELVAGRTEILLLKKSFDVFTNPNAEALLDVLDPAEVILFGVATDVCDHAAVVGLLRRGRSVVVRRGRGTWPRRAADTGVSRGMASRRCRFTTSRDVTAGT